MSYTPGPWRLARTFTEHGFTANDGSVTVVPSDEDRMHAICDVKLTKHFPRGKTYMAVDAERDANARLIATAPQLYQLLQQIMADVYNAKLDEKDGFWIKDARQIIAAIEGGR